VAVSLVVVGLILMQVAAGLVLAAVKISLILVGFAAIGLVGAYLWRRGDLGHPEP
jgi:hypothetical protein